MNVATRRNHVVTRKNNTHHHAILPVTGQIDPRRVKRRVEYAQRVEKLDPARAGYVENRVEIQLRDPSQNFDILVDHGVQERRVDALVTIKIQFSPSSNRLSVNEFTLEPIVDVPELDFDAVLARLCAEYDRNHFVPNTRITSLIANQVVRVVSDRKTTSNVCFEEKVTEREHDHTDHA